MGSKVILKWSVSTKIADSRYIQYCILPGSWNVQVAKYNFTNNIKSINNIIYTYTIMIISYITSTYFSYNIYVNIKNISHNKQDISFFIKIYVFMSILFKSCRCVYGYMYASCCITGRNRWAIAQS